MAMVSNDKGSAGGKSAEAAKQKQISNLYGQVSRLDYEIGLLQTQQQEVNNMIASLGVALGYLEQAKEGTKGIRDGLSESYNGYNAKTYLNQIDECQGDIEFNISAINRVLEDANKMLVEITEKIRNMYIRRNSLRSTITRLYIN